MNNKRSHMVSLITGDGIDTEVTAAARKVLAAAAGIIDWESVDAWQTAVENVHTTLPDEILESIQKNKVALKGPLTTAVGEGFKSVNGELRKKLDLCANVRPVRSSLGLSFHHLAIDLIIVRENTEDLFAGLENDIAPGIAQGLKIITDKESTQIARFGFNWAREHQRKTIHAVHKANIMKKVMASF